MIRTVFVDFLGWLAAPQLITPEPLRRGWRTLAIMVCVYLAGLIVLGIALIAWQRAFQLPAPEAFHLYSPAALMAATVLAAPIGEEALFRGWLTGRPRALWLLAMAVLIVALLIAVGLQWHDQIAAFGVVAAALAALIGWLALRRRAQPPVWFVRGFAVWFALSVVVFALSHLANYPRVTWALVPMVLPQAWAGLVFGYLRMRHGLPASMLAHATGNAVALAVALGFH